MVTGVPLLWQAERTTRSSGNSQKHFFIAVILPDLGLNDFPGWTTLDRASTKADTERSTSACVVAQEHTLIRITGSPFQTAPPHQHSPDFWIFSSVARVSSGVSQATRTWLKTTSFRMRNPCALQLHCKPAGVLTQAIDQLLQPLFSKGFEGCPEFHRPGAPAHFRCI